MERSALLGWDEHYYDIIEETIRNAGMVPLHAYRIYGTTPILDRLAGYSRGRGHCRDPMGRSPDILYEVGLAHVIGKKILILTMDPEDVPIDLHQFVQIHYSRGGPLNIFLPSVSAKMIGPLT